MSVLITENNNTIQVSTFINSLETTASSPNNILTESNTTNISVLSSANNITINGSVIISSDIIDLDEHIDDRVSLLLQAGNYINLNYDDNLNRLTINATGLQTSGNYSLVGHSHQISDVSGLQTALDNKQPSGIYASGIHYHTSSDITNFNSSVSGIISAAIIEYPQLSNNTNELLNIVKRTARAWINFNGTGTIAIRSSFGISSIIDNNVGDYTINFSVPFASTNYSFVTWARDYNTDNTIINNLGARSNTTKTVSSIRLIFSNDNNAVNYDSPECNIIFFGA